MPNFVLLRKVLYKTLDNVALIGVLGSNSNFREQIYFKFNLTGKSTISALLQVASLGNALSKETSSALWIERTIELSNLALDEQTNDDKAELRILRGRYVKKKNSVIPYGEFAKHDIMKRNHFHKILVEKMKEKIQMAAQQLSVNTINDANLKEVAQHIVKCQENASNVDESRKRTIDIQRRISTYLRMNTKTPLVVHGSPGCGKSTTVSMAAKLASDNMADGTILVLRFLGSTRHSSNLRLLLRSICFQLSRAFGNTDIIPEVWCFCFLKDE